MTERNPTPLTGIPVTTWYLEMLSEAELMALASDRGGAEARIEQVENPTGELSRWFYEHVGRDWMWIDRLSWDPDGWRAWVASRGYEMWVAWLGDARAGYLELDGDPNGDVEIAYFGLLPRFIGLGLGGRLLYAGVRRAWERGATRVWVHTCSLDAPHARANYEARGFCLYDAVDHQLPKNR